MAKAAKDGREGRTKVVAFRVSQGLYEEIEEIKARAGLFLLIWLSSGLGLLRRR